MAGTKGRSGRKSNRKEIDISELYELSIKTVREFIISDAPLENRTKIAIELVKRYMPTRIIGEGFETKNFISIVNQIEPGEIRGLIESLRNGVSTQGPTLEA